MKDKDFTKIIPVSFELEKEMSSSEISKEKALNTSVIRVIFKEECFLKKYKAKVEQFFKELLEEEENVQIEHEFERTNQSFQIDKEHREYLETNREYLETNGEGSIPFYSTNYEDVLHCPEPEVEEKVEETNNKPQSMTCFNCRGDHHLKDCPEKIDRQRINANKKDLMQANTSRYHIEEKKNAVKPGCPSSDLRKALGLKDNQLPRYIYSMRVIGYPPGWTQEAVHETSGLSLYDDANGNSLIADDLSANLNEQIQYDVEKFVNYPGFNSPVPDGFKDEWFKVGSKPIQQEQQLSEALKHTNTISSKTLYKRKYLPSTSSEETKKSKNGMDDNESKLCWSPQCSSTPDRQMKPDSELNRNECDSPVSQKSLSFSLSKSPGTPIVGHGNPCRKLPDADKFARDITEHMPFENLPDAVGKYENLRNVLSDVQKKLKDIQRS